MFLRIASVRQLLAYTVAGVMALFGFMIITDYMHPVFIQTDRLRIMFGVLLILFGIFRFFSAYFAEKRDRILEDDSWKSSSPDSSKEDVSSHS